MQAGRTISLDAGWYPLELCIQLFIKPPQQHGFETLLTKWQKQIAAAYGSPRAHQSWLGGWSDHTTDVCNMARMDYQRDTLLRPGCYEFTLHDVMVVAIGHDVEKLEKYVVENGVVTGYTKGGKTKDDDQSTRVSMLEECGIDLTPEQVNAMLYVEGEFDYEAGKVKMSPLAALVAGADLKSARGMRDYPKAQNDPWSGDKALREK